MPPARPVPPDRTFTMDRRATRRFFLLRPDADRKSQRILFYVLGHYAQKHGIVLHAMVQMSNHWHVCPSDPHGVAPLFFADVHRTIAMCIKEHRGWDEEVWNKSQTSVVDHETPEAVLDQLAYVMTNPIAAGMVETLEEYPGALTRPEQLGLKTFTVKRPDLGYLSNDEKWPKTATLRFELPAMLIKKHKGEVGARRALVEAVEKKAKEIRLDRAAKGLGYLGADAVLRAPITTQGTKEEAKGERKPTFAADEQGAYRRKVEEQREWREAYATRFKEWRAGTRDGLWPANTWRMRVVHGVLCEKHVVSMPLIE